MVDIEKLRKICNYDKIYEYDGKVMLIADSDTVRKIPTINKSSGAVSYYINVEELVDIPVCVYVKDKDRHCQYWTLNGELHRENDKPARVYHVDVGSKPTYIRQWFRNGVYDPYADKNKPYRESNQDFSYQSRTKTEFSETWELSYSTRKLKFNKATIRRNPDDGKFIKEDGIPHIAAKSLFVLFDQPVLEYFPCKLIIDNYSIPSNSETTVSFVLMKPDTPWDGNESIRRKYENLILQHIDQIDFFGEKLFPNPIHEMDFLMKMEGIENGMD